MDSSFRLMYDHGTASQYWEVQRGPNSPLVLDTGKHVQVDSRVGSPLLGMQARGLGAVDATLRSLSEDNRSAMSTSYGGGFAMPLRVRGGRASPGGYDGSPSYSVAELSSRRRDAIKAAWRRVDPAMRGWAPMQDLIEGVQRLGNLTPPEQSQVIHGICSSQSPQAAGRVTFAAFATYYQTMGNTIEKDREFEDALRHHWGFSEVSDILDDMKNKFAMVGLAYAFRDTLSAGGNGELSAQAFQDAITRVGIEYGSTDVRRLFDAFECGASLGILRFIQHLTSASRPPTPIASLNGSGSMNFSDAAVQDYGMHGMPPASPVSFGYPGPVMQQPRPQSYAPSPMPKPMQSPVYPSPASAPSAKPPAKPSAALGRPTAAAAAGTSNASIHASASLPEAVPAPPFEDDDDEPLEKKMAPSERHNLLPDAEPAPPEVQDDQMPLAPREELEDPCDAPQDEDDDDEAPTAPPEVDLDGDADELEMQTAPPEGPMVPASSSTAPPPKTTRDAAEAAAAAPVGETASASGGASAAGGSAGGKGRRRAVTIGINYIGTEAKLDGCINDSDTFITLLTEEFGFDVSDIRQLRDDHPQRMPTRKNILAAMKWLVNGAQSGDHLFFHYSGHGTQVEDTDGDELDGKDEALVPQDYAKSGTISDDDLRRTLVQDLPKGCRLTCIMDCCHSGTAMDLPYVVMLKDGNCIDVKKKPTHKMPRPSLADVVLLSGCLDEQTSADAGAGLAGNTKAAGAMTTAFKMCITKKPTATFHELLDGIRKFLKAQGFPQLPQLSSEHFLKLSDPFMPEAKREEQPAAATGGSGRPPVRKALTVGINYFSLPEGKGRLSGCVNDSDTMIGILKDTFGFQENEICRLRDDRPNMMPTKANMLAAFRWLTQGAADGDELFFHFSGHGGQVEDKVGDEADGKDETLIPCDFQTAGMITDDELYELLVEPLPKGVNMWVILDCCHSGSALDLPYTAEIAPDSKKFNLTAKTRKRGAAPENRAEVLMISGCQDLQTSADVSAGSMGVEKAAGAMTTAFRHCVNRNVAVGDLLHKMRDFLKKNGYEQVPQMSSEQFVQLDAPFVTYAAKTHDARVEKPTPAAAPPTSPMLSQAMTPQAMAPQAMTPSTIAPVSPMQQGPSPGMSSMSHSASSPMLHQGMGGPGMSPGMSHVNHSMNSPVMMHQGMGGQGMGGHGMSHVNHSMNSPVMMHQSHPYDSHYGHLPAAHQMNHYQGASPMNQYGHPGMSSMGGFGDDDQDARLNHLQAEIQRLRYSSSSPQLRPPRMQSVGYGGFSPTY